MSLVWGSLHGSVQYESSQLGVSLSDNVGVLAHVFGNYNSDRPFVGSTVNLVMGQLH